MSNTDSQNERPYLGKKFVEEKPVPLGTRIAAEGRATLETMAFRGKRAAVSEGPVVVRGLHEEAAIVVDLVRQLEGDGKVFAEIHGEAVRAASGLQLRLEAEKSRASAQRDATIDALAQESLERQTETVMEDCPLDSSMDAKRWAEEAMRSMGLADFQLGEILPSFFSRALGAGIAAGRVRERQSMIAELAPVFRNVEILDMWAEKMEVPLTSSQCRPLHKDPDARRWAREFIATIDQLERKEGHKLCDPSTFDEGWLLSWFANAMCASYDWAEEKHARAAALKARQRNAHVFGPLLFTTHRQGASKSMFDRSTTHIDTGETFSGLVIRLQPWRRAHGEYLEGEALIIAWKFTAGPGWWARLRGKWRMHFGFCPACNSDAPGVDRCEVCNGYTGHSSEFPPNAARKSVWLRRFMQGKGVRDFMAHGSPTAGDAYEDFGAQDSARAAACASDSCASIAEEKPDTAPDMSDEARLGY